MAYQSDEFLTMKEAAGKLRISTRTLQRYITAGHIPAIKMGSGWRIPARALWELAEQVARGERPPIARE